jgi:hypothetical protein
MIRPTPSANLSVETSIMIFPSSGCNISILKRRYILPLIFPFCSGHVEASWRLVSFTKDTLIMSCKLAALCHELIYERRERFSTARHHLGYYRCVANTAKYSIDEHLEDLSSVFETAVAKVILQHPALCCGIINEDKKDPAFIRLNSIDVSKCIEYRDLDVLTVEEYDQKLAEIIEHQHRQLWPHLDSYPGWKVIIVQSKTVNSSSIFDMVFAFHHALADGLSGMVFHRSILKALNDSSESPSLKDHVLTIPDSITLKPALEKVVNFKVSWRFFLGVLWLGMKPKWLFRNPSPPWTGSVCAPLPIQHYASRVKFISIQDHLVSNILAACREQKSTLTGLLHGLVIASLTSRVPSAPGFIAITPYSLRNLTGLSATDEMGVQVAALSSTFSLGTISAVRGAPDPHHLTEEIWKIARTFRTEMSNEISRMPNDSLIGLIPYVTDMHKFFTSRVGKPRSETYELSNVGVLKNEVEIEKWRVKRVIFTQSAMATGPAVCFSVASVAGGPLVISASWLEGDIDEQLVDEVVQDIECGLRSVAEGKEVKLGQ